MNRLSVEQKTRVVAALVERNSIRSTVRMTGVAKNSVIRLLLDLADMCAEYHDKHVKGLRVRRLQCDEIWAFVGSKMKNASPEQKAAGLKPLNMVIKLATADYGRGPIPVVKLSDEPGKHTGDPEAIAQVKRELGIA